MPSATSAPDNWFQMKRMSSSQRPSGRNLQSRPCSPLLTAWRLLYVWRVVHPVIPLTYPAQQIDYDKVLVMDKGSIMEYDSPAVLLRDKESRFYALCKASGPSEFKSLRHMANEAERRRKEGK